VGVVVLVGMVIVVVGVVVVVVGVVVVVKGVVVGVDVVVDGQMEDSAASMLLVKLPSPLKLAPLK